MVPPASRRIPRVLRYSGTGCSLLVFTYAAFTLSGPAFQQCSINNSLCLCRPTTPWSMLLGLGYSHFSSGYLDVSVPRVPSACAMYLRIGDKSSTCRVSPFGYQGIYACLRLPLAFRSLPRPSSALGALASTLCSSSLDYVDPETRYIYFRLLSNLFLCNWSFKTFSRLSSLCSCQGALQGVILGKWVAVDSNHRPLAYQASALTD